MWSRSSARMGSSSSAAVGSPAASEASRCSTLCWKGSRLTVLPPPRNVVDSAMTEPELSLRERLVLEAVIRTFVETAAPAASRTIARSYDLGVSAATIRNTMSDLEEKGFLIQPHASAGRMPTDKAYRYYVDALMKI